MEVEEALIQATQATLPIASELSAVAGAAWVEMTEYHLDYSLPSAVGSHAAAKVNWGSITAAVFP